MNYIKCSKVRRFGLYVSMVTDCGLHTRRTVSCSLLSLRNFEEHLSTVTKPIKPASVTTANDITGIGLLLMKRSTV